MTALARLSLANRALVGLATLITVVAGLLATTSLRQELIPELELPIVAVVAPFPGASPEIVEAQVTAPIEAAASGLPGLETVESTASGGLSVTTIELAYGTDIPGAQDELTQAIAGLAGRFPEGVDPQVITGSIDDFPVVQLAASGGAGETDLLAALQREVVPALQGVEGVRDVSLSGVRPEVVTVVPDQVALAAAGLAPDAIAGVLAASGTVVPAGQVTTGGQSLSVQVGQPLDLNALRQLPLPGPAQVSLGDVATVELALEEPTSFSRADGETSIGIAVTKTADGNTVDVSHAIEDLVPDLEAALGQDGAITVVFDQAPFIEQSIEDLTTEGLLGLGFAVLVILVFLLSVRLTLVTAVSIPLSLLIALIGLNVGGYSLNILTLGALTVAVGRVVDDSIVVIENIKRHLSYGEPRGRAILDAVREVAGAITASTLTTVAVFLPIGIVGGQAGELFRPFAVTVALALGASLLVSLTIVPVLASWFVRGPAPAADTARETDADAVRLAVEEKERSGWLQRGYLPILRTTIARPVTTLLLAGAVLAGTLALATQLQTQFIGAAGQNTLSITQELPAGTSLAVTDEAAGRIEGVLAADDAVASYQVTVGASGDSVAALLGGGGTNQATFAVTADDDADVAALTDRLRKRITDLGDVGEVVVSAGRGGAFTSQVEVVVQSSSGSAEDLAQAAEAVTDALREAPGATDVSNNLSSALPTLQVQVDRGAAAAAGLTEAQIGQTVAGVLRGAPAGSITTGQGRIDVVIDSGAAPTTVEELRALALPGPAGPVRLDDVADVVETSVPASVSRQDGQRSATITATPADEDLGALTADLQAALDDLDLPDGTTARIGGVSADQEEAFADLGMALLAAVAIVYLVMVATFRSLLQPLILLVSVPFAATGAIGMLLLTGTPLGVPSLIGMLMLVGIVVTNAIVLIDLVNQYRRQDLGVTDSVLEGGRHRLRPIVMTALATVFALVPMALGLTGGSVFISQPLALVVIGGLISSTILTLVLVPVLYVLLERLSTRMRRRLAPETAPPAPLEEPTGARA